MKFTNVFFLALFLFIAACSSDVPDGWSEMSLLKYGAPLTLMAPDSSEVKTMELGLMKDITVKKGDDYYVQITMSEATSLDVASLLEDQKKSEQGRSNFSRIVSEEPGGFIVERKIDSTRTTYDFRYVLIKGDQQFLIQTGLSGFYSEEEVKKMFESVKQ